MSRNGKGSAPRSTVNYNSYSSNFDRIFGQSSDETFDSYDDSSSSGGRPSSPEEDSDEEQEASS